MQPRCLSASVAMADSDYAINHVIHSLCLDVYGQHNHNDVWVSSSRRADDITRERRREGIRHNRRPTSMIVSAPITYNPA